RVLPARALTVVVLAALTLTGLPADVPHGPGSWPGVARALAWLDGLVGGDLAEVGQGPVVPEVRGEARALLFGFSEYHLDRRIRSLPLLARAGRPAPAPS
ncbi:MAG TPA: hypothetical protein VHH92_02940, partial [Actinomycetota bacterium]|nr:hypothetical protein [Actinomycetota bacterium]